jgi:putative acetyltransferase
MMQAAQRLRQHALGISFFMAFADLAPLSSVHALLRIESIDPQHADAQTLLHEAGVEARALYPKLFAAHSPPPSNPPLRAREVYLIARREGIVVACGALRQVDAVTAELHRMLVTTVQRRQGIGRLVVHALEAHAQRLGYRRLLLETGKQQKAAMSLYAACGFKRTEAYGPYVGDDGSVCYGKALAQPD